MDFEIGNWIEVEFVWLALVDSSSLFFRRILKSIEDWSRLIKQETRLEVQGNL
jgi:hypothetical protein